jgi:hypothetical protein
MAAELMANAIEKFITQLKEMKENDAADLVKNEALRVATCRLARMVMFGELTKIDEISFVSSFSLSATGDKEGKEEKEKKLEVLPSKRGADLKSADGKDTFEHKAASLSKKKMINVNWKIPVIPADASAELREECKKKIKHDIDRKMSGPNGGLIITISSQFDICVVIFNIHRLFLKELLCRMVDSKQLGTSGLFNLGCLRCAHAGCGKLHRLEKYAIYSQKFIENGFKLNDSVWPHIFAPVSSNCRGIAPSFILE